MSENYILTDVHGCYLSMLSLIKKMGIKDEDTIINLGDVIDRGPRIKECLDFFKNRENVINILGNHEFVYLHYAKNGLNTDNMYMYDQGMKETIEQLGDKIEEYADFIDTWELYVKTQNPEYVFCHASYPWEEDSEFTELHLWERWYHENRGAYGKFYKGPKMIHGHTPTSQDVYEYNFRKEVIGINLDGGCVYGGLGTCLRGMRLSDEKIFEVEYCD